MKTLNLILAVFLLTFYSCNLGVKTNGQKVTFGIHEIVQTSEIPGAIIDTLKSMNVQIENNQQQPVIGYISKVDSIVLQFDLSKQNFKIVKTIYPVDKEQNYYAVVAIKLSSIIDNSHIKKTKVKGNNVEIYFNMEGAKKWANFTKQNIGKSAAFVIDNQIYTMPEINGEIKNGIAIINGISNEVIAKNISESLNSSIPE